jgi:hypothetical protein
MLRSSAAAVMLLSFALATGTAWAEDAAPAAPPAAKTSDVDKKAISKACTDQANAKGLHGKARKKFRSECKHNGGKAE